MKRKPIPSQILKLDGGNASAIGKCVGRSAATVRKWQREGIPKSSRADCVAALVRHQRAAKKAIGHRLLASKDRTVRSKTKKAVSHELLAVGQQRPKRSSKKAIGYEPLAVGQQRPKRTSKTKPSSKEAIGRRLLASKDRTVRSKTKKAVSHELLAVGQQRPKRTSKTKPSSKEAIGRRLLASKDRTVRSKTETSSKKAVKSGRKVEVLAGQKPIANSQKRTRHLELTKELYRRELIKTKRELKRALEANESTIEKSGQKPIAKSQEPRFVPLTPREKKEQRAQKRLAKEFANWVKAKTKIEQIRRSKTIVNGAARLHGKKKGDRDVLKAMIEDDDERWLDFLNLAEELDLSMQDARNTWFSPKVQYVN